MQFAEVETFLMKECEQVERTRQRIAAERARMISARFGSAGATSPMSLPGVGPSMVNNNTSNNRQQIISASPSQPSIPGYNNNQPVHPHMPIMPWQQMFGMGPRLPVSAIQQSPILQMSCSTLQGMYSLLSINQCFDLYLVLALV